jgi:Putative peptidoglycan binding domain
LPENPAFYVAMVVGTLMLGAVCFVYIKHQTFGLGGISLSAFGVILLGMSVWRSIDISFDEKGVKAKLSQVEAVANQAAATASQAQAAASQAGQAVVALRGTVETSVAQQRLKAIGLYSGAFDGVPGPETRAAIARFQADRNLPRTGELDEATKRALQAAAAPSVVR